MGVNQSAYLGQGELDENMDELLQESVECFIYNVR